MLNVAKIDANQTEIVDALRRVGAEVESLAAVGHGVPDLLIGFAGDICLIEIKSRPNARLTPHQVAWHRRWSGYPVYIVHDPVEALRAIGVEIPETTVDETGGK